MHWKRRTRKGLCTATLSLSWCAAATLVDSRLPEVDEFGLPGSLKKIEAREAYRQREAARPGATWVDIKDAVAPVRLWLVRVAANDYLKAVGFWVQIKLLEIVKNIDGNTFESDPFCERQGLAPRFGVHVAADGVERRN